MSKYVGIRHEDKYALERRAPLTPKHVKFLVEQKKIDFLVETSKKRIFKDEEYENAGATIVKTLDDATVIFGVKEMPDDLFQPDKTYVFFSHVIKGRPKNMPMLRSMMKQKSNLIDYEKIVDEQNRRLIFFGRYAGLAGMINSFWAMALRLKHFGKTTNLLKIKQAHHYHSLEEAKNDISNIGQRIAEEGIPYELRPFVIGFTGYGNVSQGAQEICGLLPVKEISPEKLLSLKSRKKIPDNIVYKVIFKESDMYEHVDGKDFDLQDYFLNPHHYRSKFEQYIPHISMLINCVYWDDRYPRLLTKEYLKRNYIVGNHKMLVVGDISCDVNGAVECTEKSTTIENPLYIYHPQTAEITEDMDADGVLIMAVDILPSELPRDSSESFADVLSHFVKPILDCDFDVPFTDLDLPRAIKKALILHKGEFTPEYEYLEQYI